MVGAVVQGTTDLTQDDASNHTTVAKAFGSNPTTGNLNEVTVCWGGTDDTGIIVTDSQSNTYVSIQRVWDSGQNQGIEKFYSKNITGGATTVTATFSGAGRSYNRLLIAELSGLHTTAPLDVNAGQFQASPGTGTDAITSGAMATTAEADEYITCSYQDSNELVPGSGTLSAGTSFVKQIDGGTGIIALEHRNVSSTGAYAGTWTRSTNQRCSAIVSAYKLSAAGTSINATLATKTKTTYSANVSAATAIQATLAAKSKTAYAAIVSLGTSINAGLALKTKTVYPAVVSLGTAITATLASKTKSTYSAIVSAGISTDINATLAAKTKVTYAAVVVGVTALVIQAKRVAKVYKTYKAIVDFTYVPVYEVEELNETIPHAFVDADEQQRVLIENQILIKALLNKLEAYHIPPTGFRDILGDIIVKGVGSADPKWRQINSSVFYAYKFDVNDECWMSFHIPHDFIRGSDFFIHTHWLPNGTNVNPVKWQNTYMHAKGHNQEDYDVAGTIITSQDTPAGSAYRHYVSETDAINVAGVEPDSVVYVHIKRITNGATDNTDDIFVLTNDIHYESNNIATLNRSPDFYS